MLMRTGSSVISRSAACRTRLSSIVHCVNAPFESTWSSRKRARYSLMFAWPATARSNRIPIGRRYTRWAGPVKGSENAADLALERRDVLGGDLARLLRFAVADRDEQVPVLVHAIEQVRQPVKHEVPDAERQVEVALERLLQVHVAGAAVDEAVDLGVEAHQRGRIAAALALVDLGDQPLELLAQRGCQPLGRARRGVALEQDAHIGDLCEVRDVDLRRECPAARKDRDEVLERKPLDRLAHRRPPHLELAPQRVLIDGRARGYDESDDAVAELGVGTVGEQLPGLAGRHHLPRHRPSVRAQKFAPPGKPALTTTDI